MKTAVTISLVPEARGGPFVFSDGLADGCERAAGLGFDAVEIFPPAGHAIDIAELQGLLDHHKLRLAAMGTGGGWLIHQWNLTHRMASVRKKAREFIRSIIDVAGGFGAPTIIGSMQGRWEGDVTREQALSWLADALEDLGEHATRHGTVLLYEPLNRYETNLFNRQGDAAAWLRTLKTSNIRILADFFHMNIEEEDMGIALRDIGPLLGHVHFADSNRRAVGLGHAPIGPVMATLAALGYNAYISAEILPLPDPVSAAKRTMESFRFYAD